MLEKPVFVIITGTNGVGKSTLGKALEERYNIPFINPDLHYKKKFGDYRHYSDIELRETSDELKTIRNDLFQDKKSFVIERILDHESIISKLVTQAHKSGFDTALFYVGVDQKEISKTRIENRLSEGAHNVDPDVVDKNLKDCIRCFKQVAQKFDNVVIFDNSKTDASFNPKRVYDIRNGIVSVDLKDKPLWAKELVNALEKKIDNSKDQGMGISW
jgi:predicted ABC-type ATPase